MSGMMQLPSFYVLLFLASILLLNVFDEASARGFPRGGFGQIGGLRQRLGRKLLIAPEDWDLIKAAIANDPDSVITALDKGADINAQDFYGFTALHWAAFRAASSAAKELIDQGAAIDMQTTNFLWLHGLSIPVGASPIYIAASLNRVQIAEDLLEAGADANMEAANSWSPIHRAAELDQTDVLKVLLGATSERNFVTADGTTPLHIAAFKGSQDAAQALIDAGFDKEYQNKDAETPLHLAAGNFNNDPMVEVLSKAGCDPNAENYEGWTPLHKAAWTLQPEGLQALITYGGDVEKKNTYGETVLHVAAQRGYLPSVNVLLANGADRNATSGNGKTPGDFICTKVGDCPDRDALEAAL